MRGLGVSTKTTGEKLTNLHGAWGMDMINEVYALHNPHGPVWDEYKLFYKINGTDIGWVSDQSRGYI